MAEEEGGVEGPAAPSAIIVAGQAESASPKALVQGREVRCQYRVASLDGGCQPLRLGHEFHGPQIAGITSGGSASV